MLKIRKIKAIIHPLGWRIVRHKNRLPLEIPCQRSGGLDEIRCCGEYKQGFSMNEERFNAFEKMLSDILANGRIVNEKTQAIKL